MPSGSKYSIKAFTLIELLVVISIVALLSSVVLASLNNAREKGRLASAVSYATQVDHIAGDQAVALWEFDECGASAPVDRSGFRNNGSFPSGTVASSVDTPSGKGCSLSFDGSTAYVDAGTSDLGVTDQVTVSAWVKASTASAYAGIITKHTVAAGGSWKLGMSIDAKTPRFDVYNSTSYNNAIATTPVIDGLWHHIVGTYDGSTSIVYVDGIKRASATIAGGVRSSTANILIGNDGCCGGRVWNGLIDNVHIFSKTLTAAEVGDLYASERPKFRVAAE